MYQIPELTEFPNLIHGFSTKNEGDMSFNFRSEEGVVKARKRFLGKLNLGLEVCVSMRVQHEDKIMIVDAKDVGKGMKDYQTAINCDGLVTNEKGLFLFLKIADCLPIILFDPSKMALGLVHAGWKGVHLEIAKRAVLRMVELYKSELEDIVVGIGPCAYKNSFMKKNPSQIKNPKWQPFLEKIGEGLYKVDFLGLCKKQLLETGIKAENIFESGIDTVCDKRFFSHVREHNLPKERQGRFACAVGIKGAAMNLNTPGGK